MVKLTVPTRCRWIWIIALASSALPGCAEKRHKDLKEFLHAARHDVSAIEYRVSVPDVIAISAPRIEELDREVQRIQPNGKISLKLLGEVKVTGLTAKEIAAKLTALIEPYYEDPKIQVRLVNYESRKFYVVGEVGNGGPKRYTGRDSLLDVLTSSGLTFVAWRSQVQVIRPDPQTNERKKIYIDVDKMVQSGDMRMNILLEPGDIVYVPPTPLGWVGYRIREVLDPFTPVLRAYRTPAEVMAANDEYTEDDEDD